MVKGTELISLVRYDSKCFQGEQKEKTQNQKKIILNRRLLETKKQKKMTLVIGAKFNNGAILIADRKVTDPNSSKVQFIEKLKEPYPADSPICFGATGLKNKYDQFNRKILLLAAEHMSEIDFKNKRLITQNGLEYPKIEKEDENKSLNKNDIESKINEKEHEESIEVYNYTIENFLEDSQDLIRKLCTGHDNTVRPILEVLTTMYEEGQARLHHIDFDGSEEEVEYYAIGSGADYVNLFLEKFWNKEMDIEEILKLAYFCIYYVQDLEFDSGVGVEEGALPNDFFVTNDGKHGNFTGFNGKEKEVIDEIREKVNQFKVIIDKLSFKRNEN